MTVTVAPAEGSDPVFHVKHHETASTRREPHRGSLQEKIRLCPGREFTYSERTARVEEGIVAKGRDEAAAFRWA